MARVGSGEGKYPPTEFSQKYAAVLAPKEKLVGCCTSIPSNGKGHSPEALFVVFSRKVSPKDVFGESGVFDADVEEKTRQAFKITMKKLDKLNAPTSDKYKEDLEREKLDQVGGTNRNFRAIGQALDLLRTR